MSISRKIFESQVLALLGSLERVARRLARNDADAEDLVAETVARAWQALDSLRSEAAFRAWIFRILNNTFISERRRAGARPRFESFDRDGPEETEPEFSIFEHVIPDRPVPIETFLPDLWALFWHLNAVLAEAG